MANATFVRRQADQRREESTTDAVQAGIDLRWKNHMLQGHSIAITQRYNDTMNKIETRSDSEARKVMQGLATELNGLNGTLAEYLARMSNANHGLVEMLQKSEDGRAVLMMRRAAEMLVKVRLQRNGITSSAVLENNMCDYSTRRKTWSVRVLGAE